MRKLDSIGNTAPTPVPWLKVCDVEYFSSDSQTCYFFFLFSVMILVIIIEGLVKDNERSLLYSPRS